MTFVQRRRSQAALDTLRDLSSPRALVLRDGPPVRMPGKELVVGDIVLMAEGDRAPADVELLEASDLTVDESPLTGESQPVLKQAREAAGEGPASAQHLCFFGSLVTQGTAQGRVVATGPRSALGRIGASLSTIALDETPILRETAQIVQRVATDGLSIARLLAVGWALSRGGWLGGFFGRPHAGHGHRVCNSKIANRSVGRR